MKPGPVLPAENSVPVTLGHAPLCHTTTLPTHLCTQRRANGLRPTAGGHLMLLTCTDHYHLYQAVIPSYSFNSLVLFTIVGYYSRCWGYNSENETDKNPLPIETSNEPRSLGWTGAGTRSFHNLDRWIPPAPSTLEWPQFGILIPPGQRVQVESDVYTPRKLPKCLTSPSLRKCLPSPSTLLQSLPFTGPLSLKNCQHVVFRPIPKIPRNNEPLPEPGPPGSQSPPGQLFRR